MPADPNRVAALFASAVAMPAEARAAYLDQSCGGDAELRRRIEALLQAHADAGSFLESPVAAQPVTVDEPLRERPGTRIGPYKLLQQIGEGGMGVVYMAEQEQPLRRRVALKIIKPGMDSTQVIARFESERQALAMMDHPNIAKVLDAGATDSGRPYFVMELVYGVPITKFCDDSQLTPRQRLELFVPICQAIQHAHQKGIIHRDIKPSNVLVTMHDDKPVPKVIDFGVAKATEQRLTERSLFTAFGAMVGTLEYMSPEQAEMNAFGVDTRSDVYSLGVLLYELLTGTTPLERKRLREAAYTEVLRLIKEVEPPRPSVRLSSSGDLPKIAAARKTEPGRLSGLLRGEIDWIVMRCLEKDRTRRYESASALARDVERYLHDEAVEACPPSTRYRLGKFTRKHKTALVTAASFAALLVVGVVISTLLAVWATSAEGEANRQRIASDEAKQAALDAKQDALNAKAEALKQLNEARLTAYASGMKLAQHAFEESNVVRARELLDEIPKEVAGRDLRGFEWYYLSRLIHSEILTLTGHADGVTSVAFSPDGQRLASGSGDQMVKIWESATGKELFSLEGHSGVVTSVAFSPDGQRLASGSGDKTVKIWDSVVGKELFSLKGHSEGVRSVAFSPDDQRLASASEDKTVKVWDSVSGKELFSLKGHGGGVTSVAFSPDGQRLASASWDKTVKVWDSVTGKELFTFNGHESPVTCVAFNPDGHLLASGQGEPFGYATLKVWDSTSGKEEFTIKGPGDVFAQCVAFSPDGKCLASGRSTGNIKIWDSGTGQEMYSHTLGDEHAVESVAFSPDGRRLAATSGNTVRIWNYSVGKELFSFKNDRHQIRSVVFSPDGQRLSLGRHNGLGPDGKLSFLDSVTGRECMSPKDPLYPAHCVAFSPDGQRLASGGIIDRVVRIWDSVTGKELFDLKGHPGTVESVAFSPDGRRLASGSGDGLDLFHRDRSLPKLVREDRLGHILKIWDSVTGKELFSLKGHSGAITGVAFSPDGQRLASGSGDKTVKIWDSVTGKELFTFKGHGGGVTSVAFSPDGQRLASASDDKSVKVWDRVTCKELFSLKGHSGGVTSVAFNPDGQRLASASADGTVKIWDSVTGKELFALKGHGGGVTSVAFSPDGQRLACANRDFSIHIWETTISPEIQERRAAHQLVAGLFRQMGLRADVRGLLRTLPGLNQARRQEALAAAQTYPENPYTLKELARKLVVLPDRRRIDYRKALRCSERASQLDPGKYYYLNTLGVAYYRVGDFRKALEALHMSDKINQAATEVSSPADLAFLAMTQQRLGHEKEARAYLQQLRERMKDPHLAQDTEAQSFLREAETLLAKPKAPGGK